MNAKKIVRLIDDDAGASIEITCSDNAAEFPDCFFCTYKAPPVCLLQNQCYAWMIDVYFLEHCRSEVNISSPLKAIGVCAKWKLKNDPKQ
jgi:hypothetical protein